MQGDEFATKQVLAGRNALGNGDCLDAFVCNEAVDAPFGAVEGVLGDLSCCISIAFHMYIPKR
jgi:hypothetical protein